MISSSLLFCRQRGQGSEKWHNLLETTQLGSSRAQLSLGILVPSRVISPVLQCQVPNETRREEGERECGWMFSVSHFPGVSRFRVRIQHGGRLLCALICEELCLGPHGRVGLVLCPTGPHALVGWKPQLTSGDRRGTGLWVPTVKYLEYFWNKLFHFITVLDLQKTYKVQIVQKAPHTRIQFPETDVPC